MIEYQYIVSDYYATGEGITVSLLITRAYPRSKDYDTKAYFDDNGKFCPGTLKTECTPEVIARRTFSELFGTWLGAGAVALTKEEFIAKCGRYLSPLILKIINEVDDPPGNFQFYQQYHINFA